MGTVAQTLGPEALVKFVNPSEAIQRLAAAQGIDVLNLIRTPEELQAEQQKATCRCRHRSHSSIRQDRLQAHH